MRVILSAAALLGVLLATGALLPQPVSVASTIQLTATPPLPSGAAFVPMAQTGLMKPATGSIFVQPRWAATERRPVAYLVVLDAGAAMSYNFAGYGTRNDADLRCEAYPPETITSDPGCDGGVSSAWKVPSERRVYVLKQALITFIDQLGPNDPMRIIAFAGGLSGHVAASSGWSTDKAVLKQMALDAGALENDPYRTSGATTAAEGMQAARTVLAESPPPATPNGEAYRTQVIYITDSIPNIFLDGTHNDALDICPQHASWPPADYYPECQLGSTADQRLRPLAALIDQAQPIKSQSPATQINVIALGAVPTTGLEQVASDASLVTQATGPSVVQPALDALLVQQSICVPAISTNWLSHIGPAHLPDLPALHLPPGVFGYATITSQDGEALITAPIAHSAEDGALGFEVAGLEAGSYFLSAYVGYRGDDGVSRVYDRIHTDLTTIDSLPFMVTPSNVLGPVIVLEPLRLALRDDEPICP